jgi:hypothetical protein
MQFRIFNFGTVELSPKRFEQYIEEFCYCQIRAQIFLKIRDVRDSSRENETDLNAFPMMSPNK